MWVLECLPEIESDMSVFHRVEDVYVMRADTFFRRAEQLPAYEGALRARLRREQSRVAGQPGEPENVAQEVTEDALWASHRQRAYAQFLSPGEVPREVSVDEGMRLAAQAFRTGG